MRINLIMLYKKQGTEINSPCLVFLSETSKYNNISYIVSNILFIDKKRNANYNEIAKRT